MELHVVIAFFEVDEGLHLIALLTAATLRQEFLFNINLLRTDIMIFEKLLVLLGLLLDFIYFVDAVG